MKKFCVRLSEFLEKIDKLEKSSGFLFFTLGIFPVAFFLPIVLVAYYIPVEPYCSIFCESWAGLLVSLIVCGIIGNRLKKKSK